MRLPKDWYAWVLLSVSFIHSSIAEDTQDSELWQDLARRNLEAEERLIYQQPQGVKKMSDDRGEKFWPHFWQFDAVPLNASIATQPFALHYESFRRSPGSLFRRDGTCPSGYSACTSINQPNSCCPNGNTCITVQDTGNGPVGCCPAGETCGNTISGCDTSQGYSSCPNSDNKGCCIPGYACSGSICVNIGTQVITATTSTTTASSTSPVSVVTVVSVNNSGFTTTATVTATVTVSASTSSSGSAEAPVRPTSSASNTVVVVASASTSTSTSTSTVTTTTTTSSSTGGYCPTGYYMCSAVYLGGCCQVDRDCNTTSCPSTASTTVINGSPTVVAPTGATSANGCANGWYSCPVSLGGNCCPSGYNCAQSSCPAAVDGVSAQSKQAPSEATIFTCVWSFLVIALVGGVGMVVL